MSRSSRCPRWAARAVAALLAAGLGLLLLAPSAGAHGFTTVTYVSATSPSPDHVRTTLGLEYDLTLVSAATAQHDDPFFKEGQPAWDAGDYPGMTRALADHSETLLGYVRDRFAVTQQGRACAPRLVPGFTVALNQNQGVPYLTMTLDYACPHDSDADLLKNGHEIRSGLFPDSEGYITQAKTVVTYSLDGARGSAALDASHPAFSTKQGWGKRFWEFFHLGMMHLLTGPDHLLFLTALIVGSRRLREIVLAATTFTIAHSVTLALAAFGVVHVSPDVVEPLIALSISAVAAWHVIRLLTRREHAADLLTTSKSHFALDAAGWTRLGIVFCFGLVHGMGFAGALGIDHAWSWELLWSLLFFNVGIETVQLGLIVLIFPALALLRHRKLTWELWATGAIAAAVSVIGLLWFIQRLVSGPGA